jgi:hypothetical protein
MPANMIDQSNIRYSIVVTEYSVFWPGFPILKFPSYRNNEIRPLRTQPPSTPPPEAVPSPYIPVRHKIRASWPIVAAVFLLNNTDPL